MPHTYEYRIHYEPIRCDRQYIVWYEINNRQHTHVVTGSSMVDALRNFDAIYPQFKAYVTNVEVL